MKLGVFVGCMLIGLCSAYFGFWAGRAVYHAPLPVKASLPTVVTEYVYAPPKFKVETIYVDKPVDRIVEKVIVEEKEIAREVPVCPRHFRTIKELRAWVDAHHLPIILVADGAGEVALNNIPHDPREDCDDYAEDYQALALESGLILTECPVMNGRVWGVRVMNVSKYHVGCWAKVNGTYYYIETAPGKDRYKIVKIMDAD